MNWYKQSAKTPFIDTVQVVVAADDRLVLLVGGQRYEYAMDGKSIAASIERVKKWLNKIEAGKKLSAILQNIEQFRIQPQAKPKTPNKPNSQMSLFSSIKTAAPYSENICPVCTTSLLVDFWHEKGHRYADAPFVVGKCPQCGAAMSIKAPANDASLGFTPSAATEITHKQLADALKSGIPSVLVVRDDGSPIGATSIRAAKARSRK